LLVVLLLRVLTHALQYDRVDSTEFQSLKDEIESLKGEQSAWETSGPRIPRTQPSSKKR
jgi:hypothetical protein